MIAQLASRPHATSVWGKRLSSVAEFSKECISRERPCQRELAGMLAFVGGWIQVWLFRRQRWYNSFNLCPHLFSPSTHFWVRDFNFSIAVDWSLSCRWIWCLTVLTSAASLAFKLSENLVVVLAGIAGDRRMQCTYSVSVILNGPGTCLSLSWLDCCSSWEWRVNRPNGLHEPRASIYLFVIVNGQ